MNNKEYTDLKEKYVKWKKFLIKELQNYEKYKEELQTEYDFRKKIMIQDYEAVRGVVLELENYGIGVATKNTN